MDSFKEKINDLIAAPEYQDQANYQLLREQVGKYPYCQSLRLAIARHSNVYKLVEAESLVALAAIYAPDRIVLFNLMSLPDVEHAPDLKAAEVIESFKVPDKEKNELTERTTLVVQSGADKVESADPVSQDPASKIEITASVVESSVPVIDGATTATEITASVAESSVPVNDGATTATEITALVVESSVPVNDGATTATETTHWAAKKAVLERTVADEAPVRKTFLYWLKKTQKGYFLNSTNTNTSVSPQSEAGKISNLTDPLAQNYQVNNFALPVIDSGKNSQAIEFDPDRKEDQLIKQYLTEDPQHIKPNQLLNDQDNVDMLVERASKDAGIVTETLAAIYYQQKQFEKALKAYDDLRLKFPNKSAYFADLHEKIRNEVAGNK